MGLSACASRVVAIGDWGRPADLGLSKTSLEGVTVDVRCARKDSEGHITEHDNRLCPLLLAHLKKFGAIEPLNDEDEPEFTLWYIDYPAHKAETSGLSEIAFYFTAGIVPFVSTRRIEAELRVEDARGVTLDRQMVELQSIRSFGWGSWIALFTGRKQTREISDAFLQFATNRVVSQAGRVKKVARGER